MTYFLKWGWGGTKGGLGLEIGGLYTLPTMDARLSLIIQ